MYSEITWKKPQRFINSAKKFTSVSVQNKTNGPLVRAPHFQNKMGSDSQHLQKRLITNGKVAVKGIKTEDWFSDKKIQQKDKFLQQKHSSAIKNRKEDLYTKETVLKFTSNSSNTPVKGYTPNGGKLISKCKSRQFSSSRKAAIFYKALGKIDKQSRNLITGFWSKNRLHFGKISGKGSTSTKNVSTGIVASDKGCRIYVEEGSHPKEICEKKANSWSTCF